MTRETVFINLTELFRDIFDDDSITLTDSTTAKDIIGWDSLMHVTIMAEIEEEFDILIPMDDKSSMKNVGEIADKILELKK